MHRVLGKIFIIILSVVFINSAFAIDSEYKNSLNKIEFTKISGDYYTINLYTQKNYNEPLKVIKKSDLNYYILLPETKNAVPSVKVNTNDIRSVNATVYPYAGQDVNNGYTKITINTTKPFTFDVNVKNTPQIKSQSSNNTIATNTVKKENLKPVEKKNFKIKQASAQKKEIPKISSEILNENKAKLKAQKPVKPKNTDEEDAFIASAKAAKFEDIVKDEVEKEKLSRKKAQEQKEQELNEVIFEDSGELEHVVLPKDAFEPSFTERIAQTFSKFKIMLSQGEFGILGIIISVLAAITAILGLCLLISKRPKTNEVKIKPKSELIDFRAKKAFEERKNIKVNNAKKQFKENSKVQEKSKEQPKPKEKGEFFQFEGNIKQTGLCTPTSSNASVKKYELHNYDPDLYRDYVKNKIEPYQDSISRAMRNKSENEYDIIRKIIKEETFSNVKPKEFEFVARQSDNENSKKLGAAYSQYQKNQTKKQTPVSNFNKKDEVKNSSDPIMLSSVEIAPERGFMCISYNNNISLIGYLFDDVFALYNFKQPKLENYEIQYRLSEKTENNASFIVKVEKTKMLIKVTKNTMQLEIVM